MRGHTMPFVNVMIVPVTLANRHGSGAPAPAEKILRLYARVQSLPSRAATSPK